MQHSTFLILFTAILAILAYQILFPAPYYPAHLQPQPLIALQFIQTSDNLLHENGTLKQVGWMHKPMLHYNRQHIAAHELFIKEWDYYLLLHEHTTVAITIGHLGYVKLLAVFVIQVHNNTIYNFEKLVFFPNHRNTTCDNQNREPICTSSNATSTTYHVAFEQFVGHFTVQQPVDASKNAFAVVIPFANEYQFYYNYKVNQFDHFEAHFTLHNDTELHYNTSNTAALIYDSGRGVWPYSSTWYWSQARGKTVDKQDFGFNLGYGFGNTSHVTENILFVGNQKHKLQLVTWKTCGSSWSLNETWHMAGDGLQMQFVAKAKRIANVNFLLVQSAQYQFFGHFSGTYKNIKFENVLGFAEEVHNKW